MQRVFKIYLILIKKAKKLTFKVLVQDITLQ